MARSPRPKAVGEEGDSSGSEGEERCAASEEEDGSAQEGPSESDGGLPGVGPEGEAAGDVGWAGASFCGWAREAEAGGVGGWADFCGVWAEWCGVGEEVCGAVG